MGLFDFLGGGNDTPDGGELRLPEWYSPWVGGFGLRFGDNNAQVPYLAPNPYPGPYFDYYGAPGSAERVVVPEYFGNEGYIPSSQFAGPSGYPGYLPNLGFLYGQMAEGVREGTHPGFMPLESGFDPRTTQALQWMDAAVPALTPYTGDALQGIRRLLRGETELSGQGAVDYFSGLPAPIYARGHNPMYTAGLGALGGAGRMFPTMLDPMTEGARRSALSGMVPVGTYQPVLEDIERRGTERQADLTREFEEEALPGLVQRLATGQSNYGSAGERLAERLTRTYGEQQRRIEQDTEAQLANIHSQAAMDALTRQYGAMGLGAQAAQNIFRQGADILGSQMGLEQGTMGSQMDRALRAAQLGMGTGLDAYQIGLTALPSINDAALDPLQRYFGMGLASRDISNAILADRMRRDPLNISLQNLQTYGSLLGATPQPTGGFGSNSGNSSSGLANLGALLSGLGSLWYGFRGA